MFFYVLPHPLPDLTEIKYKHITLLRTGKFSYELTIKVHTFQISVSEILFTFEP